MFALLFFVGFFGFVGMAGLSFLHSGHDSHTGNHGSTGEAIGGIKAVQHAHSHGHGHARVHHSGGHKGGSAKSAKFKPWWAFSPFDILAYCTGAGAVGEILRQSGVNPTITILAAVAGALFFNFALAKPVLNLLLRFESRQSEGLEGQIAKPAEAVTKFDTHGRGLIKMALDGQIVQCLGVLDAEEFDRGVTVAKGDTLLVVDVDAAKNTCRVTRELAS